MILRLNVFPFPISNHDAIRHIKKSQKNVFKNNYFKMFKKAFRIITLFGI
jgi:hypothetical protein